jgi:hypothetical protein
MATARGKRKMIQYSLKCSEGHGFDSWFQSGEAYEKLIAAGLVSCVICGSSTVEKAIMTPRVQAARDAAARPQKPTSLGKPANAAEQAMAELRKKIEDNSDYVGMNFVSEARAMFDGGAPERAIYGEARPEEAIKLLKDGVPVAPLPFLPSRKTN